MKKEDANFLRKTSKKLGLKDTDVTSGLNGYPEPFEGIFISGFDNFQSLDDFIKIYDGEHQIGFKKDGWSMVKLKGTTNKPFTPFDLPLNRDSYDIVESKDGLINHAYGIYFALSIDYKNTTDIDELEEIKAAKEAGDDLIKECSDVNFKTHNIILSNGEYWECVEKESMRMYHDGKSWEIGAYFNNEYNR